MYVNITSFVFHTNAVVCYDTKSHLTIALLWEITLLNIALSVNYQSMFFQPQGHRHISNIEMAKDSISAIGKKPLRTVHLLVLPCLTSYLIVPLMAHCSRRGLSVLMLEVRVPGQCLWLVMQFSCIEVPLDPRSLGSFKNHLDFNHYEWPSSECIQSWQIGGFIWHVFTKSVF